MNDAQKALLARLRDVVEETPKSGALNAGGKALRITRFSNAVEARADDGPRLVDYVRSKVHEKATTSYSALIDAGRPDLTAEAIVADPEAAWATEFTDEDRDAANTRLGLMHEAKAERDAAKEAEIVAYDRKIVANVSASRVAKGKPALTPEQEFDILQRRAAERRDQTT
ncbi:MAG: hypothetical protein Q7T55_25460 [Solirubrobacteraceae bacterium]|nr:hypothetical protein [Solirubrobacteraceae bacterium]